jgi:4-aminobutyrate aminotransferase-like enzyme
MQKYFQAGALDYLLARYDVAATDLSLGSNKVEMLVDSIIPSDTLVISGRGAQIVTNQGLLLDFQSMTVNCILGQNDPWVKLQQISYLLSDRPSFHTTKLGSELYYSLPERLSELKVAGISNPVISHRQCNGSDAVENAIKAAKNYAADRKYLVSFVGSYHGQNLTAYSVSDVQKRHAFLAHTDSVVYLPAPDGTDRIDGDVGLTLRERESLGQLRKIGCNAFAVILEPIQMNNGVQPFSASYLRELRAVCDEYDICLIYDEIQTGFGWLGSLSAAEFHDVPPHIAAFGKAVTAGNGPLALIIAEKRFHHMEYGTASKTNGADVRSIVAAHAVLDRLLGIQDTAIPTFIESALRNELSRGLIYSVPDTSANLWGLMQEVKQQCPEIVGRLKGGGLICGVEILDKLGKPNESLAEMLVDHCFEQGLFLRKSGHVLIIKVPAVITYAELEAGCNILRHSLLTLAGVDRKEVLYA